MTLREALDRTLLLMRDEIETSVPDEMLIAALTGTRVALVADAVNLATHSAQSAFVTAALLMARSGHAVHLIAPDIPMIGLQLPLAMGRIVTELCRVGGNLLPGVSFSTSEPLTPFDLVVGFGDTALGLEGQRRIHLNATDWSGTLRRETDAARWGAGDWPLGALAAAVLAATEAFKCTMQKLAQGARNPERIQTVFAPTDDIVFRLAPENTPKTDFLGAFDCISGGAILHAALYALSRIPGVRGHARVIEPDTTDISNLNRYALLLLSKCPSPKAEHLAHLFDNTGLIIDPISGRYDETTRKILVLAPSVLVGVDDIPTRWHVQRANPNWLAVGATTHWCAMVSFHEAALGCAECAHPYDDPDNGRIPTVAFVSFWAGLLTATLFLRHLSEAALPAREQQIFLTSFRAENAVCSAVARRSNCSTCNSLRPPRQTRAWARNDR